MSNSRGDGDAPLNLKKAYVIDAELDDGKTDRIIIQEDPLELGADMGASSFERIELQNGGFIDLNRAHPPEDMTLKMNSLNGEMRITSLMMLVGELVLSFPGTARHPLTVSQACAFRFLDEPGSFELLGGKEAFGFSVTLTPEVFVRYLNNDVPKSMRPMLEPRETGHNMTPFPVDPAMRQTMANSVAPGLSGTLRQMQMEGAALLYISLVARALENGYGASDAALTGRERNATQEAYDRLCATLRDPPTLSQLSQAVGLTEKRLNTAFRELYGGSVFEILRAQRLELARELIEQGDMAIKEISWQVGYAHASNFTAAFTGMFGMSPAAYAKSL